MADKQFREATHGFETFVRSLCRGNARHVSWFGVDPPAKASVERTSAEVLDAFFKMFPEHREFRSDISKSFPVRLHSFVADTWNEVTKPAIC